MDREEKLKVLKELGGMSEEDFDRLYLTGLEDIRSEFKKLMSSYGRNDVMGFRMAAHAIKGISANYRIKKLPDTCKALSLSVKEKGDLSGVAELLKKLEGEVLELR